MNDYKLILLAVMITVLAGCEENIKETVKKKTYVSTVPLSQILIEYTFHRPARAVSLNDSTLSSELSALVDTFHVQVGDSVKKGVPLVSLNCEDTRNRLLQAKAKLAASEATAKLTKLEYQRGLVLFKQKTIPKRSIDQLKSESDRDLASQNDAFSAYQIAKSRVNKCTINAPFDGLIVEKIAHLGQLTVPASDVIRITDTTNLEVIAQLTDDEVNTIQSSQQPYFLHNEQRYPLAIRTIIPAIDTISRTQEVRFVFKEKQPLPGSRGILVWAHPLPAIPAEYLSSRDNQLGILYATQEDEKIIASFKAIQGAKEGQPAPITMDKYFNEEAKVLVDGRFGIHTGEEIFIAIPPSNQ